MKKKFLVLALVAAVGTLMSFVNVQAGGSGEKGFISGVAVEISTYAMKGKSEGLEEAMLNRVEQGFPVGIVEEETGELWVCVYRNNAPASGLQTGNEAMKEFIGKKVIAQGLKFSVKGVNVIRFGTMSEY
jgi:hypothetical protein